MATLPAGTVSLLFSDLEGSTALLNRLGSGYAAVLATQRELLREAWATHGGTELGTEGDSFYVVFPTAAEAGAAAVQGQRALETHAWPDGARVRARIGVHTGTPELVDGAYVGMDVHRAARISAASHGGQVVVSASTAALLEGSLGDAVRLKDLGLHRLKDIPRPERLYQLTADGLQAGFPPLRSLGGPSRLPLPAAGLVGRERELAEVLGLVGEARSRLVTLIGPGGSGKTRMAVEVARRAAGDFPGGAYFVPLEAASTSEEMWAAIVQSLDLSRDGPAEQALAELAGQGVLLVLDNLEQIAEADVVVEQLLAVDPGLCVLATSRRPLHQPGEHEYPVLPLALPTETGVDGAEGCGAIQLFVQEARLVRPGFLLTEDNVEDVVSLCRGLDGLPLAVRLAAARSKLLSPSALLKRLDTSLDLASPQRQASVRQRSLRSTVEWSYHLLDRPLQGAFRRLGVFVGGGDLSAVEQIIVDADQEPRDVLDLVDELVDASLVTITETPDGEPRVALLDTIQRYTVGKLTAHGELDQVRLQHARLYRDAARRARPAVGTSNPGPHRAWFELEDGNLRAAVSWALPAEEGTTSARSALGLSLCAAVGEQWLMRDSVDGRDVWFERAVERAGHAESAELAECLRILAAFKRMMGDARAARTYATASVDVCRRLDDHLELAWSLTLLAGLEATEGHFVEARPLLVEAMALGAEVGDRNHLLIATLDLAIIEAREGYHEQSRRLNGGGIRLALELRDPYTATNARHNLACTLFLLGRTDEARELLRDTIPEQLSASPLTGLLPVAQDYAAMIASSDPRRAAVLMGAADGTRRAAGIAVPPVEEAELAETVTAIRSSLTAEEWQSYREQGSRTDIRDVLAAVWEAHATGIQPLDAESSL